MKKTKWIIIFLLIPLAFTDISDYKDVIQLGLKYLGKLGPEVEIITEIIGDIFGFIVSEYEPDPNAKIIDEINELRQEIESELKAINSKLDDGRQDILNEIEGAFASYSLGEKLDDIYSQLNSMITFYNTINSSEIYTQNEKYVEMAYLIGNFEKWTVEGNMVFNINRLAKLLAGITFTKMNNKDLYQIVYDNLKSKFMFSGEVYDESSPYIEKVMRIYLLGCGFVFACLKNSLLISNFTDEEIAALSPLVNNHYFACAMKEPSLIYIEFEFIAQKVYDITNPDSLITHYSQYIYKQRNERNIFINKDHSTPVPIADKVNYRIFQFEEIDQRFINFCIFFYCPLDDYIDEHLWPFFSSMKNEVENYGNNAAITPENMNILIDYLISKNYTNNRQILSFLHDKGIDTANSFEEEIYKTGKIYLPVYNLDTHAESCYWESLDRRKGFKTGFFSLVLDNDNDQCQRNFQDLYSLSLVRINEDTVDLVAQQYPKKIFTFDIGQNIIIPSTAKEINLSNIISYNIIVNNTFVSETLYNYKNVRIVILGFNNDNNNENEKNENQENFLFFNIYFTSLNNKIVSSFMKVPLHIKYKNETNLRNLDDEDYENFNLTICFVTKGKQINNATCQFPDNNKEDIDSLEIIPNFTFYGDKNIKTTLSPIANKQKNNLNNIENFDYSNYTLYTLENSDFVSNGKTFNISGIIKDPLPDSINDSFVFTFNNKKNEDNENSTSDVKCRIINIKTTDNNYTLNCESNQTLNSTLDSGISIVKDKKILLLITFNDSRSSDIEIDIKFNDSRSSDIEIEVDRNETYHGGTSVVNKSDNKSNKKHSTLKIVLIIVIPIIAVIIVIASIIILKKAKEEIDRNKNIEDTNRNLPIQNLY